MICRYLSIFLFFSLFYNSIATAQPQYTTTDYLVQNGDLQLQVRKVTENLYSSRRKIPLLLVHGGTGALTSFDLDVADASFAQSLADAGFTVYLMNVRGWERSTAPVYDLADTSLVAGSCQEAAADIDAVVSSILKDAPQSKVNLFGWAAGGHWASYYATLHPEKISHLVVLNSLYGVKAPWSFNGAFADLEDSLKFNNSIPAMRQSDEQGMLNVWKTEAESGAPTPADSVIMKTFVSRSVSFNSEHLLKVPGGFRKESFYMANGRKYWDAKDISVPILLIRGEHDFWSRPTDIDTYFNELPAGIVKKKVVVPGAGHFVFLDVKGSGRRTLVIAINNFIKKNL
ncbi:alpha/beta hydrolase [Mucilaginibacter terrenus]|uniref:Alpha/beta hydrolase n=1 Tax=Mucilaginibacter terrenus TaxID=2482727 RepID=A0A3E2NQP4_9SPHI|nr:alpha/beta hydrolase [Mucilaginibacter terrenus]RFZ83319.1 alpha/beta hydrolase [Mucilaginibacter terrenus]